MYGSDFTYSKMPHNYKACSCFNREPHCWYCGLSEDAPIHIMTVRKEAGLDSADGS